MGTGLKVLNNSIDGLTLAAIAFDNIENDGDLANNSGSYTQKNLDEVTGNGITDAYGNKIEQNNLYGAAAIYSSEWFSADAGFITYGKKGKIGVKYDAYSLGLDYTHDYAKGAERYINGSDVKTDAFTIRAGYKYSDKLNFAAWWEIQNAKATYDDGSIKDKYSRFRFDARYDF